MTLVRLAIFIIALLLAVEAIEPATGWFIAITVLSGATILLPPWRVLFALPAVQLTIFIIALLLAIGAIEPTAPWLVTLAVLSGIAAFFCWQPFELRPRVRYWVGGRWDREYDW